MAVHNFLSIPRLTAGSVFNPRSAGRWSAALAAIALALAAAPQGNAQTYDQVPPLPAGALPIPGAALPPVPTSGQQYLIYVNNTSEATLNQVRRVEPTAFRTTLGGQPVIQAGRFNMTANAQQRVSDLAALGVRAEITQVAMAAPNLAQTQALPANVYASGGGLPPLPDVAFTPVPGASAVPVPALPATVAQAPPAPGNVVFGQELDFGGPVPPPGGMVPPPAAAPPVNQSFNAPYFVVIPTDASNLANLSNQVIQLGTPAAQVQQRTAPRGPHVAVGPFTDRGLANRWNNFFRDAGIGNSRVHFER